MTRLIPTDTKVLLRFRNIRKDSSILIPDNVKGQMPYAEVLEVGPDVKGVKAGQTVLFMPTGSIKLDHNGEELYMVKEEQVLGIYHDEPEQA